MPFVLVIMCLAIDMCGLFEFDFCEKTSVSPVDDVK